MSSLRTAPLVCLALAAWATAAAQSQPRQINLVVGKGELITFDRDIARAVAVEPAIANVIVVGPRELMVAAKGPGKTTVVVWEQDTAPVKFDIRVETDNEKDGEFQKNFKSEIARAFPDGSITIQGNAETLVVSGMARDQDGVKRAAAIAQTYARNVVNLVKTPPAPDPQQILLQVKFASVDRVGLDEMGFNYFSRNTKTLGQVSTQQFSQPRFSQLLFQDQQFSNATLNIADLLNLFVFRPDMNIGATVRALQARNLLQILAEPNLITVEGREASFIAGGEFPFPTLQATPTGGAVAPVVTVQFKKFGVQLKFTPTVMANGAIHLKVNPEVSSIDYSNAVTLVGMLIPAISTRTAETEVILKDGESFAIAGLIDNRVVQTVNRIRGLGDIPILGSLFRSRSTRKSTDELLVVITPRFVKPLTAEEKAKLPDTVEDFLPTVAEQRAAQEARKKASGGKRKFGVFGPRTGGQSQPADKKPEFVGPRGHQEPKK